MAEKAKENAAKAALAFVKPGMCVGLGTGSTAEMFVKLLAEKNRETGMNLRCIPTSQRTADLARANGLRVVGFDEAAKIDLTVDGADCVSRDFTLLKGLGGALTREKIVAYRAKTFVVIVDEGKMRQALGGTVPVEVLPFALSTVVRELKAISSSAPTMRKNADRSPFRTDDNNYIIDMNIQKIADAAGLEMQINEVPGVVENGIFRRADMVIVGSAGGHRTLKNRRKFRFPYLLRRRA